MQVQYEMVVDFARPNKTNTIIISEGDNNSRLCRFTLLANKIPFDMTGVNTATVRGISSQGTHVFQDATFVYDEDGNKLNELLYLIPNVISNIPGKTTITITLNDIKMAQITSFDYYIQTQNSLYNEDDYIEEVDLDGFRNLLNKSLAALQKVEAYTDREALKNPYPLNMDLDGESYNYIGDPSVDVNFGYLARVKQAEPEEAEDSIDETAAQRAVQASIEAKESAELAVKTVEGIGDAVETCTNAVESTVANKDRCQQLYESTNAVESLVRAIAASVENINPTEIKGYADSAKADADRAEHYTSLITKDETVVNNGMTFKFSRINGLRICRFSGNAIETVDANGLLCTIPDDYLPIEDINLRETFTNKRIFLNDNGQMTAMDSITAGTGLRGLVMYI